MKKVIYILSVGHSGSTLLDITLGQFKNTFSTGELKHLIWQYYRQITNDPTTQKCTCGKSFNDCEIWSKVIDDLAKNKKLPKDKLHERATIKHLDSLSFFTNYKWHKVLRHFYKWCLVHQPGLLFFFHKYLNSVNQNNRYIYESIFNHNSKIEYIIDSTKEIIRYNELKHHVDAFPIILIRDIEQIKKSQYVKNESNKNVEWLNYYNKQVLPLIKDLSDQQFHIVSYEMFIHNPEQVINDLAEKIKIDKTNFKKTINMENYHLVAGNPMRYEKEITIREKEHSKGQIISNLKKAGLNKFFIERI